MISYYAKSLEDIAEMFDTFAENVKNSPLQNTNAKIAACAREAYVWKHAAQILRDTKLED